MIPTKKIVAFLLNAAIVMSVVIVGISILNDFNIALPVEGVSMKPAINSMDLAIVLPWNVNSLHVGDIIVYRYEGILIIHRVIAVHNSSSEPYVIVKGDNNSGPDTNYTYGQPREVTNALLVGKVVALVQGLGILTESYVKYIFSNILVILVATDYYITLRQKRALASVQQPE